MRLPSSPSPRVRPLLAIAAAAAIAAPLGLGGLPAPAHAAPEGVEGAGDAREPYLVDEADDLRALAEAVNAGDASTGSHIDVVVLWEVGRAETVRLDMDGLRAFTEAAL